MAWRRAAVWLSLSALLSSACVSVSPSAATPSAATPPTTNTSTPTVTATAPPAGTPDAPAAEVILQDDFDSPTHYLSDASVRGLGSAEYADGVFRVTSERQSSANFMGGGTVTPCLGDDCRDPDVLHENLEMVTVEVDATQTDGSGLGWYGIACGFEGVGVAGGFVGFTISADGRHYAIARNPEPGVLPFPSVLGGAVRGEIAPSIRAGIGEMNRVRADCGLERAALSVNGLVVATAANPGPAKPESKLGIALLAAAGPDEAVTVDFDNLVVSELSAEPTDTIEPPLIFEDPLTEDLGLWATGRVAMTTTEITAEGMYVEFSQPGAGWLAVPSTMDPGTDTVSEITFELSSDSGAVGLMCRSQPRNWYLYYLYVDEFGDAYVALLLLDRSADPVLLSDWAFAESLVIKPDSPVTLRFDCVGSSLAGYVNGDEYARADDSTITVGGYHGINMEALPEVDQAAFTFTDYRISRP